MNSITNYQTEESFTKFLKSLSHSELLNLKKTKYNFGLLTMSRMKCLFSQGQFVFSHPEYENDMTIFDYFLFSKKYRYFEIEEFQNIYNKIVIQNELKLAYKYSDNYIVAQLVYNYI